MNDAPLPWVVLVAGEPRARPIALQTAAGVEEPRALLRRARSLTALSKTCCLLEEAFKGLWQIVVQELWPSNVYPLSGDETLVQGVLATLASISEREAQANVILVPFNHCAVEEVSWLTSASGALRLGSVNRNTVYMLHDNPNNDPRVAAVKPGICTSSVMVGAASALMTLCLGKQDTSIVDLVVGAPSAAERAPFTESAPAADTPLNVVHVRLAEEYASLQRDDVWHRAARTIDLRA